MTLEDDPPPGQEISKMLLRKSRGQLIMASERIELLGHSENDAQLWMCLAAKVKSDEVKNNIA